MAEPARRYELLERIAAGGMGEVFRAQVSGEHGFKKPVAVKRILPEAAGDPQLLLRLIAEAKTMVALSHANIVQVFDLCRADDELFIVMELIDGPDLGMLLRAAIQRHEPTPIDIALYLATETLKALAYAHGTTPAVVHCDISPSNLLVSAAGEVKITDFGIARSMKLASGQTKVREAMGKLRYMAPERVQTAVVDPLSDIYAVGVVLWEVIAMRQLFRRSSDQTEEELIDAILREEPPALDAERPDVPPALAVLVARAVAKQPAKRPRSAAEMLHEVARIAHEYGPSVTAPEVGAWVRGLRASRPADLSPNQVPAVRMLDADDTDGDPTEYGRPSRDGSARTAPPTRTASRTGSALPTLERPRTLTFHGKVGTDGVLVLTEEPVMIPAWRRFGWIGAVATVSVAVAAAAAMRQRSEPAMAVPAAVGASREADKPAPHAAAAPTASTAPNPSPSLPPSVNATPSADPPLAPLQRGKRRASPTSSSRAAGRPATDAHGFLNVYSEPWANVSIDGREVGTTPILKLRLATGEHRLRLSHPARAPYEKRVHIVRDQVELVSVELDRD